MDKQWLVVFDDAENDQRWQYIVKAPDRYRAIDNAIHQAMYDLEEHACDTVTVEELNGPVHFLG